MRVYKLIILLSPIVVSNNMVICRNSDMSLSNLDNNFYSIIDEAYNKNIKIKAQDINHICYQNNNIIKENELKQYWAYDAIRNKNNKFYSSLQNLKKLTYKAITLTRNNYDHILENIAKAVILQLLENQSGNKVLSLMNGFICAEAMYSMCNNDYYYTASGKINIENLYKNVLLKFGRTIEKLGYDHHKIWYLIEKIINNNSSKKDQYTSFREYFKHDFDCYLNQFWVLTDGMVSGAPIKSVISEINNSKNKPKKVNIENNIDENDTPTCFERQLCEKDARDEKIVNGRDILDELEITMGVSLKELAESPVLKRLKEILADRRSMVDLYEYIYHPWKELVDPDYKTEIKEKLNRIEDSYQIELNNRIKNRKNTKEWFAYVYCGYDSLDELPSDMADEGVMVPRGGYDSAKYRNMRGQEYENKVRKEEENKIAETVREWSLKKSSIGDNKKVIIYLDWLFDHHPEYSLVLWQLSRVLNTILCIYNDSNDETLEEKKKKVKNVYAYLASTSGSKDLNVLKTLFDNENKMNRPLLDIIARVAPIACVSKFRTEIGSMGSTLSRSVKNSDDGTGSFGNTFYRLYVNGPTEYTDSQGEKLIIKGTAGFSIDSEMQALINLLQKQLEKIKPEKVSRLVNSLLTKIKDVAETKWRNEVKNYSELKKNEYANIEEKFFMFHEPLLICALSTFMRSHSFAAAYIEDYNTELIKTYETYKKYRASMNQSTESLKTFLKKNDINWWKYVINLKRFINTCLMSDDNSADRVEKVYTDKCGGYLKKLEELEKDFSKQKK